MRQPRQNFRRFFQTRPWSVPIAGVVLLLLFPILLPSALLIALWPEIRELTRDYFTQVREALTFTGFSDE
jgi:hypothetical protein